MFYNFCRFADLAALRKTKKRVLFPPALYLH